MKRLRELYATYLRKPLRDTLFVGSAALLAGVLSAFLEHC